MKTIIAIPCLDHIDADFAQSLVNLAKVGDTEICFLPGTLVYVGRERLAELAIAKNADYILWLDSDMVFDQELLADLMRDKKDIVAGLCFRRRPPFTPVIYSSIRYGETAAEYTHEEYLDYPTNDIFEVDGTGFGAILMRTEVIKDIKERYGSVFEPMRGFGEDLSFCIRARNCGYDIYCDSRVKVGHVARTLANEETYLKLRGKL